jgi:hypothetical protein
MPITANDIKALRSADVIQFSWMPARAEKNCVPASVIRAGKESVVFSEQKNEKEDNVFVPVQSVFVNYMHNRYQHIPEPFLCSWLRLNAQDSGVLKTVFSLLKPGDELTLEWRAVGGQPEDGERLRSFVSSAITTANGSETLYFDSLFLWVDRPQKERMTFFIEYCACPANSARMIRMESVAG